MDDVSDLEAWLEKRIEWVEKQLDAGPYTDWHLRYFQGQRIAYSSTLAELQRDKSLMEAPF